MSMLKKIQRGRAPKPPRILMYGVEGIGKSTVGSQAPKPDYPRSESENQTGLGAHTRLSNCCRMHD